VDAPVLLVAGDLDWIITPVAAAEFASLFPNAQLVVQPASAITRGWTTRLIS